MHTGVLPEGDREAAVGDISWELLASQTSSSPSTAGRDTASPSQSSALTSGTRPGLLCVCSPPRVPLNKLPKARGLLAGALGQTSAVLQPCQHCLCLCICLSRHSELSEGGCGQRPVSSSAPRAPGTLLHTCCVTTVGRRSSDTVCRGSELAAAQAAAVLTLPGGGGSDGAKGAPCPSAGQETPSLSRSLGVRWLRRPGTRSLVPDSRGGGREDMDAGSRGTHRIWSPAPGPGRSPTHGVCKPLPSCRRGLTTRRSWHFTRQAASRICWVRPK